MGGLGETLALLLFVVPYATLGDHPGNRIGGTIFPYSTECTMSRFTREAFPVVVTIDAHGNSLHKDIEAESSQHLAGLMARIGKKD